MLNEAIITKKKIEELNKDQLPAIEEEQSPTSFLENKRLTMGFQINESIKSEEEQEAETERGLRGEL
jgi:hypothetical protein